MQQRQLRRLGASGTWPALTQATRPFIASNDGEAIRATFLGFFRIAFLATHAYTFCLSHPTRPYKDQLTRGLKEMLSPRYDTKSALRYSPPRPRSS